MISKLIGCIFNRCGITARLDKLAVDTIEHVGKRIAEELTTTTKEV